MTSRALSGFIGKEKDAESGLGDFGVRKYDFLAGRFTSPDPMWEKYASLTPYQYAGNNPVIAVDLTGRDIMVLLDKEGAAGEGHMATLIGSDDMGWQLYSKNGGSLGVAGASSYQDGQKYDNLNAFLQDPNKSQTRYESGYRITTGAEQDQVMKDAASKQVKEGYLLVGNSCADTPSSALEKVGKDPGTVEEVRKDNDGNSYNYKTKESEPYRRFNAIKKNNKGTPINLDAERDNLKKANQKVKEQ